MTKLVKIYVLKDPITKEVKYVGKTEKRLQERLLQHWCSTKLGTHRKNWIHALKKQGTKPIIEQVDEVSENEWSNAEIKWIKHYKSLGCNLVNGDDGGLGGTGHKCSDELKQKLKQLHLERFKNPAERAKCGRNVTNAERAKIRQSLKTYYSLNPQARDSVSIVHKGKIIGVEHRKIVGAAAKQRWIKYRQQKVYESFAYEI